MIRNKKEKLYIYLIYPEQCVHCSLDGSCECKLEIIDCMCKNYIKKGGSKKCLNTLKV